MLSYIFLKRISFLTLTQDPPDEDDQYFTALDFKKFRSFPKWFVAAFGPKSPKVTKLSIQQRSQEGTYMLPTKGSNLYVWNNVRLFARVQKGKRYMLKNRDFFKDLQKTYKNLSLNRELF
jgi:hypothetical protein